MGYLRQLGLTILAGAVSAVSFFLIQTFPNRTFFAVVLVIAVVILAAIFRIKSKAGEEYSILPLGLSLFIANLSLFLIVEWPWLRLIFIILTSLLEAWLVWALLTPEDLTPHDHKVLRRVMTMLYVFTCYALTTFLFAYMILYGSMPIWIVTVFGAFIYAAAAFYVWKLYYEITVKNVLLWLFVVALTMVEVIWVVSELPFDFGSSGLFITWIWYIMQLLIRFHLSPQKIIWRRQKWTLILNVALIIAVLLFFVRWV